MGEGELSVKNGYLILKICFHKSYKERLYRIFLDGENCKRKFIFSMRRCKRGLRGKEGHISPRICGILMFIKKEIWI